MESPWIGWAVMLLLALGIAVWVWRAMRRDRPGEDRGEAVEGPGEAPAEKESR